MASKLALLFVACCVTLFSFACAEETIITRANLLLQKNIDSEYAFLAQGVNFTVQLHLYNVGDGNAFEVSVNDPWPSTFKVVEGATMTMIPELAKGAHHQVNITLQPTVEGNVAGFPAVVEYSPAENMARQTTISTGMRNVTVISHDLYEKVTAKHVMEWSIFGVCMAASILIPLMVWGLAQASTEAGLPKLKKDH